MTPPTINKEERKEYTNEEWEAIAYKGGVKPMNKIDREGKKEFVKLYAKPVSTRDTVTYGDGTGHIDEDHLTRTVYPDLSLAPSKPRIGMPIHDTGMSPLEESWYDTLSELTYAVNGLLKNERQMEDKWVVEKGTGKVLQAPIKSRINFFAYDFEQNDFSNIVVLGKIVNQMSDLLNSEKK
jgi:hypothetical protein